MLSEAGISATMPNGDTAAAVDFLARLVPRGFVALAAIVPDSSPPKVYGRTFELPRELPEAGAWIDARQGKENLYFTLNEPKAPGEQVGRAGRLKEVDIGAVRGLAIDIDPRASVEAQPGGTELERARLREVAGELWSSLIGGPCAIVDSGGGIQAIWLFPKPVPISPAAKQEVQAQARGIARRFGSDAVHSLEHLFRLPGTVNVPDAKKRAKGRTRRVASLLNFAPEERWELACLTAIASPDTDAVRKAADSAADGDDIDIGDAMAFLGSPDDLPADLRRKIDAARHDPHSTLRVALDPERPRPDRSGPDWNVAKACFEEGFDSVEAASTLAAFSPDKIMSDGEGYLKRTIGKAKKSATVRVRPESCFQSLAAAAPPSSLRTVTGRVDPSKIPVRRFVIFPRLQAGKAVQCVGEPAISKSTFALRDALIVANGGKGINLGPEVLHEAGPVIVYNAEDEMSEMEARLSAAQRRFGIHDMPHPIHLWSGVDAAKPLVLARRGRRGDPLVVAEGAAELEAAINSTGAKLVILDPLADLHSGAEENSTEDMLFIMQIIARLAARTGTCIVVVHHTAKSTRDMAGDMGAGRGAFSTVGKVRSQYTLCAVQPADAETWGVQGRDVIRMDYGKNRNVRRHRVPLLFERHSEPVGNGDSAPVLEFLKEGTELAKSKAQKAHTKAAVDVRRAAVAAAVLEAIGGPGEVALNDARDQITSALHSAGVTTATTRSTISTLVTTNLIDGVTVLHLGQPVKITARKNGPGETAPWILIAEDISDNSAMPLAGLVENATPASSGSLK